MSDSDKTAVAAHLYVTMRRVANRVIDVEWMSKNEEYAREILSLARQQGAEDLTHYADLYEGLMFGGSGAGANTAGAEAPKPTAAETGAPASSQAWSSFFTREPTGGDDGADSPSSKPYVGKLR